MDPLSAIGVWALSLVGIAALVCAARKLGLFMTFNTTMMGSLISSQRAEGAL